MADFTFFFNPMSRAQIARWALHEVGADYEPVLVPYDAEKPAAFLAANAMSKVPTIIHHGPGGDRVVTECAAICHYLAEATRSPLLPEPGEQADYFRWLLFGAGPLEQAIISHTMGWQARDAQQEMMLGFGSYERTMDALEDWLQGRDYVCGSRFTMVDVYLGSQVDWGVAFGTMPDRPAFRAYVERLRARPAYAEAKAIDTELIAQMKQPAG
ncbi:glutathione S-transferase family protein [Croceibacterium ferulae]|uniref:glutathione S-transferase family protein n=1 Tax=Croceibacterium ferulae TaxID=1854641 RepID=UPI000EAE0D7E|nr:glutathione S-transferase family protein [Croceibacterium ferulae]